MKFNNILNEEFEKFSDEEREVINYIMELIEENRYSNKTITKKILSEIDRVLEA